MTTTKRTVALGAGGVLLLAAAYLLLWPVPFDPVAWTAPAAPALEGVFAANDALAPVERLPAGGAGPESVAIDDRGRLYSGLADGRVVRMERDGSGLEEFANTGGRPLGLEFDRAGNLIVADARRGLLQVSPAGAVSVLAGGYRGVPFKFADDLDIGSDGTIYFSDASSRFGIDEVREDVLEHRPHGRLFAHDPGTGETRLLLDGLYFANGVAVAADDSYVLVCETTAYRVRRLWLRGPRAGESEVLIENLPGFPDNITRGPDGRYWIALFSPRISSLDSMMPRPWLRKVAYRLPGFLQPAAIRHGIVLAIDTGGNVVENLQDPARDSYSPITSAREHEGALYLGSLERDHIARLPIPPR